ncbi:MAG: putative glycosyltransferase EpsD [Elusimicrobia bacterium ADurb.Bin231]|nr:MAG: putative glycosyltransferase EpsD [Elusimicrobia bacterium ADurb.Bin231]
MGKGIELALKAWEKMPDNAVLLIVGTGSLLEKFERDVIRKNIIFAGFRKNIQDYLAAADVFLFPSLGEGLSNSLIEAASCGLPVLANDMPSNSEIITSGRDGVLIDMRDPQKIISEIEKLRDDQELRYIFSREARNTAVKKFSIQTVAELYVDFYSRMLAA